jgi:hypothetical protein
MAAAGNASVAPINPAWLATMRLDTHQHKFPIRDQFQVTSATVAKMMAVVGSPATLPK